MVKETPKKEVLQKELKKYIKIRDYQSKRIPRLRSGSKISIVVIRKRDFYNKLIKNKRAQIKRLED